MTRNAYNAGDDRTNEFPKLEAEYGEDPARFLESNELMATARIGAIRDPELLEAYHAVAKQITAGKFRESILEAIAERKADLGVETDELTGDTEPVATVDPVPATDGGVSLEYDESDTDDNTSDTVTIHPDVKGLAAGEVLVLERDGACEYIFPATDDADEPYLCRSFDDEGDERTAEPIGLTFGEVAKRLDGSHDPMPVDAIDVRAPTLAATNGGDS